MDCRPCLGGSLQEALKLFCLAPKLVPGVLRGTAQAVSQLHERLAAHCDLKPAQVLLAQEGAAACGDPGNVRLGDLGSYCEWGEA